MVTEGTRISGTTNYLQKKIYIFLCVVNMCNFGYLLFLHTFPANMLINCGLANINALLGQKGKKRNWGVGQGFFQTSNYIRAIFFRKNRAYICIFVIFFISCAIQYHRSVFIFTVRRILSIQLWLNVLGHSLPTKLYVDPYIEIITHTYQNSMQWEETITTTFDTKFGVVSREYFVNMTKLHLVTKMYITIRYIMFLV